MSTPRIVRDFQLGSVRQLKGLGTTLFLTLDSVNSGEELWRLEGSGIRLLSDAINPGIGSSAPTRLTTVGNTLYFVAKDRDFDYELWRIDEQSKSPFRVANIFASGSSRPSALTTVGNELFFFAENLQGRQLWRSEGSAKTTTQVTTFEPGFGRYSTLAAVENTLYYTRNDGVVGYELWKSDVNNPSGGSLVADINVGYGSSRPSNLTAVGQTLFFTAQSANFDVELWKTNSAGTSRVKDINPGFFASNPSFLTPVGNTLFFSADNGTRGFELWKSDGTERGTMLVADIVPGLGSSLPRHLTAVGNTLYFTAERNGIRSIWKSDGTPTGTVEVPGGGFAQDLTLVGQTLYYLSPYANITGRGSKLMALDLAPERTNRAPVIQVAANREVRLKSTIRNEEISLGNLLPYYFNLSLSDPDGDAITKYRFTFSSDSPEASFLVFKNGNGESPAPISINNTTKVYEFSPNELESINFVYSASNTSTRQTIEFQAEDALGAWSEAETFAITISQAPRVRFGEENIGSGPIFEFNQARVAIPFRNQIRVLKDAEKDPIVAYNIQDLNQSPESGYFRFNGQKVKTDTGSFTVLESALDDLFWVPGQAGTKDPLTLRAIDAIGDVSGLKYAEYETKPSPTGYAINSLSGYNRVTEGEFFALKIQRQNNIHRSSTLQWAVSGTDPSKAITADSSDFSNVPRNFSSIAFQPGEESVGLQLKTISDSILEGGAKGIETARIWFFNEELNNSNSDWLKNPAYSYLDFNIFEQPVYIMGQAETLNEGETSTMRIARFGGGNLTTSVTLKAQSLVGYHGPRDFNNRTGVASAGDDFQSKVFNVTFTEDGVQSFATSTIKDQTAEGPEVFYWSLENPTNGSVLLDDHKLRAVNIVESPGKKRLQSLELVIIAGVGALGAWIVNYFQSRNNSTNQQKDTNNAAFKASLANPAIEFVPTPGSSALTGMQKVYDNNGNQVGLLATQNRGFVRTGQAGNDSASLVGNDSASLVGNDSASIVAPGSGNLVGNDAASLVGNDSASLVGNDSASLVGNDSASLVNNGSNGMIQLQGPRGFAAQPGGAYFSSDLGMVVSEFAQGGLAQLRNRAGDLLFAEFI